MASFKDESKSKKMTDIPRALGNDFIAAVKKQNTTSVKNMIELGTNVNYHDPKTGKTALHNAFLVGDMNIVRILVNAGADLNAKDNAGNNALDHILIGGTYTSKTPFDVVTYALTLPFSQETLIDTYKQIYNSTDDVYNKISNMIFEKIQTKYRVLGEGAYGIVSSPAFQNDQTDIVTKFIYGKKQYEKTLQNSQTLSEKIRSLAISMEKYPREYTYGNIMADNLFLGKMLKKSEKKNTNQIYPIKMKNLGVSLYKIQNAEYKDAVLAIPTETYIREMGRLSQILIDILHAGYIHGDIRSTNVVLDLNTHRFTIIDFDLLLPIDTFRQKNTSPSPNNPPELIMAHIDTEEAAEMFEEIIDDDNIDNIDNIYDLFDREVNRDNYDEFVEAYHNFVEEYVDGYASNLFPGNKVYTFNEMQNGYNKTMDDIVRIDMRKNRNTSPFGKRYEDCMTRAYNEVDSYGLGNSFISIVNILEKSANKGKRDIAFLRNCTMKLAQPHQAERINAEQLHTMVQTYLQKHYPVRTANKTRRRQNHP